MTLYFTESALRLSTTRTDEQLDLARADVLARVARMRAGEFAATPGDPCRYCDFARMCPARGTQLEVRGIWGGLRSVVSRSGGRVYGWRGDAT